MLKNEVMDMRGSRGTSGKFEYGHRRAEVGSSKISNEAKMRGGGGTSGLFGHRRGGIGSSKIPTGIDPSDLSLVSLISNAALLVDHGVSKMRQLATASRDAAMQQRSTADISQGCQKEHSGATAGVGSRGLGLRGGLLGMVIERFSSHASSTKVRIINSQGTNPKPYS